IINIKFIKYKVEFHNLLKKGNELRKKSLIYLIVLCLSYTAMQVVCKYAEEQREDRAVPIATLIRLGMGYGISYANAPDVGGQTYTKRPPFGRYH
ncbi:TPA: hypothetical protein ACHDW5_001763, partial [Campylobacter jejuni]